MVVDSLVECCFFFFPLEFKGDISLKLNQHIPALCQVFLPNVTGQSWPVMASLAG